MVEVTDTATKILDTAQELIQTRGYSAMSFQDIAVQVGIKKPSIIHHFPSKAALGSAVFRRYREFFASQLESIKADPDSTAWDALNFYLTPYLEYARTPDKICLCGALSGEVLAVPEEIHIEVQQFVENHQEWLRGILTEGRKNGEFQFTETPSRLARLIFSALQGALLFKRSTGDFRQVEDVTRVIKRMLK